MQKIQAQVCEKAQSMYSVQERIDAATTVARSLRYTDGKWNFAEYSARSERLGIPLWKLANRFYKIGEWLERHARQLDGALDLYLNERARRQRNH